MIYLLIRVVSSGSHGLLPTEIISGRGQKNISTILCGMKLLIYRQISAAVWLIRCWSQYLAVSGSWPRTDQTNYCIDCQRHFANICQLNLGHGLRFVICLLISLPTPCVVTASATIVLTQTIHADTCILLCNWVYKVKVIYRRQVCISYCNPELQYNTTFYTRLFWCLGIGYDWWLHLKQWYLTNAV